MSPYTSGNKSCHRYGTATVKSSGLEGVLCIILVFDLMVLLPLSKALPSKVVVPWQKGFLKSRLLVS